MSSGQKKFPDHTISLQFCKNNTKQTALRRLTRPKKNAAKSGGLLSPFTHRKTSPQANGKNLQHGMVGRKKFPPLHRQEKGRRKAGHGISEHFPFAKSKARGGGTASPGRDQAEKPRFFPRNARPQGLKSETFQTKSSNAGVATRQGLAAGEERPFSPPLHRRISAMPVP